MRTRRGFFHHMADGLMGAALAGLLAEDLGATQAVYDLTPKKPHHTPKAKAVIQLFMNGGPSQVDLFDYKPALEKHAGQPPSRDLAAEVRAVREAAGLRPSPFQFSKHVQASIHVSVLLPHPPPPLPYF